MHTNMAMPEFNFSFNFKCVRIEILETRGMGVLQVNLASAPLDALSAKKFIHLIYW